MTSETIEPTRHSSGEEPAGQGQGDKFQIVVNLTNRQHSLMLSGSGDRLLIELEAFGYYALYGLVGFAKFTGRQFLVTVEEIQTETGRILTNGAIDEGTEEPSYRVGRRRSKE